MISRSQEANKIISLHLQAEFFNELGFSEKSRLYNDFKEYYFLYEGFKWDIPGNNINQGNTP